MISLEQAEKFLDLGTRIGDAERAQEQLRGAVALHNLLKRHKVAYLADEVGMGKTYVALGTIALFRHFNPQFRVLIIAPRQNIQLKWQKEMKNFVANNVRFSDLRVRNPGGSPAREQVHCDNLLDLVREVTANRDRDFYARLTSFSLPIGGRSEVKTEDADRLRRELTRIFPSMRNDIFDLRDKRAFKDNFARAIGSVMPEFDLVVVDEGHNLKHGFGDNVSARNRVLGLFFGHPDDTEGQALFPGLRRKARHVLFLSATPVEASYGHLWNQLNVFGHGKTFPALGDADTDENTKKGTVAQFLIRRVATIKTLGGELTKNLYRREWRNGGVATFDEPIPMASPQQRLVVALIQKKVNELLHQERFKASFQIGMLASFESFLHTAKLKRDDEEVGVFDDAEQTDNQMEKEGVDVTDLNHLASSFREKFGTEMPHPKMDALVEHLANTWKTGEKALVFVRRTASVSELKRKLDERYDKWLIQRLLDGLPKIALPRFNVRLGRYRKAREESIRRNAQEILQADRRLTEDTDGGSDTFFAWFFRGEGPDGIVSGATVQQRFVQKGTALATFFEDNYVSYVLGCRPQENMDRLVQLIGSSATSVQGEISERARRYIGAAKKPARGEIFEAVQAAAVEWIKDVPGPHTDAANVVWRDRFSASRGPSQSTPLPSIDEALGERTFFTELRLMPELRAQLWPEPTTANMATRFQGQELRARLLGATARLGHAFIDFYILFARRLRNLKPRSQERSDEGSANERNSLILEYLSLLESQRTALPTTRDWSAFDELHQVAANFELILDVNMPDILRQPLPAAAREFAQLQRRQQPIGGMAGEINRTLVRQFRMPGYPLVLISTDLLQEGEDLHTFCSTVYHYGISWTPSSLEQRIGRIDRVRSQTDRRLRTVQRAPQDTELLQVYFPHLRDSVEVLQVQRVLEGMNTFMRLMHEGLTLPDQADRKIDLCKEFAREERIVPRITQRLQTAFPIREGMLAGPRTALAVEPTWIDGIIEQFRDLCFGSSTVLPVTWEPSDQKPQQLGTAHFSTRQQPFKVMLRAIHGQPILHFISPIGKIDDVHAAVSWLESEPFLRLVAIPAAEEKSYNVTIEADMLLHQDQSIAQQRFNNLLSRVTRMADRLENEGLNGRDEPMRTFQQDLTTEHIDVH